MNKATDINVDPTGHIVIPPEVKSRLGLKPGMTFIVETDEHGNLQLRLQPSEPVLINKGGVLVVASQSTGENLADAVRRNREERIEVLAERVGL